MFTPNQLLSKIAHHKPVFCLFGSCAFQRWPLVLGVLVSITMLQGCGSLGSGPKNDTTPVDASGVFDDSRALDIPDAGDDSTQWSIILTTLGSPELAPSTLSTIQSTHGLIGAYISTRNNKPVIAYGQYAGPDDRNAAIDLDRIRTIKSGARSPFAGAFLAPPSAKALAGTNTEFDLRTVKERFGPRAIYTLQMGVYGTMDQSTPKPDEIKEFRSLAEQAVLELRAEGERAFYYHAPLRSMVTIGVFGEADFDATTTPAIESMALKELRKRFPHNYLNGQGIRETVRAANGQRITRLQASSLVSIPDK